MKPLIHNNIEYAFVTEINNKKYYRSTENYKGKNASNEIQIEEIITKIPILDDKGKPIKNKFEDKKIKNIINVKIKNIKVK